jgi:hypothetical protein
MFSCKEVGQGLMCLCVCVCGQCASVSATLCACVCVVMHERVMPGVGYVTAGTIRDHLVLLEAHPVLGCCVRCDLPFDGQGGGQWQ